MKKNNLDSDTDFYVSVIIFPYSVILTFLSILIIFSPHIAEGDLEVSSGVILNKYTISKSVSILVVNGEGGVSMFSTCARASVNIGDLVSVASRSAYRDPFIFLKYAAYIRKGSDVYCKKSIFEDDDYSNAKAIYLYFLFFGVSFLIFSIFVFLKRIYK
jgi:hypothetical protein